MEFPEGLSENAKKAILDAGLESIDDLAPFTMEELRSVWFQLLVERHHNSSKKQTAARRSSRCKNDEDLLSTCTGDPLNIQSFLPTRITSHDLTSLRSAVFGAAKADASPHLKQELDFLCSLMLQLREKELPLKTNVWARLVQVILKSHFPLAALRIAELWAASWSKLPDLSELALIRHVQRVRTEAEKSSSHSKARVRRTTVKTTTARGTLFAGCRKAEADDFNTIKRNNLNNEISRTTHTTVKHPRYLPQVHQVDGGTQLADGPWVHSHHGPTFHQRDNATHQTVDEEDIFRTHNIGPHTENQRTHSDYADRKENKTDAYSRHAALNIKKAKTYNLQSFPKLSDTIAPTLLLLTLLCARLGNGYGVIHLGLTELRMNEHYKWLQTEGRIFVWKVLWVRHKSLSWIGKRSVEVPLAEQSGWGKLAIQTAARLQNKQRICHETTQKIIQTCLFQQKYGNHSIRRSGARFWREMGMPLQQLQAITLHQSIQSLLTYLEE